jgi:MscS family membrane protein
VILRVGSRSAALFCLTLLLAACGPARSAPAQTAEAPPTIAPTPVPGPEDEFDRGTPRAAMRGFLVAANKGDYERAAQYLDLRRVPKSDRAAMGPILARELKVVLDQKLWVDLERLSRSATGHQDDGLRGDLDLVGTIDTEKGPVPILLERTRRGDGQLIWQISRETVSAIPMLWEEFGYGPLGEWLPALFFEIKFLSLELWQWIGLAGGLLVSLALSWLAAFLLIHLLRRTVSGLRQAELLFEKRTFAPLRLVLFTMLFAALAATLALPMPLERFLRGVTAVLAIISLAWLVARLVDAGTQLIELRLRRQGQIASVAVLPTTQRVLKVFVVLLTLIAILQNLDFNVTGILAGLGVGGLAVALAAQKSLENLFGGITMIADQPVRVGDFCRFGERVGTVEDVGLRSTRVRTLDRTVVSIPNAEFSGMQLENFSRRDKIWLHPTISLRYETTPDQLRFVLVELKKLLLAHPKIDPDPARIRFVAFGACSLDLEMFAYVRTTDMNEFHAVREDVFLRIMDIVAASGTGFAFPSQTLYLGKDAGLDAEKSRAAEAQVAAWRSEHALLLPDLPSDEAARISDSLEYPPLGSATRKRSG